MSPDSVFWFERAWYTLLAISVKVRESLVQFPGDCMYLYSFFFDCSFVHLLCCIFILYSSICVFIDIYIVKIYVYLYIKLY